MSEYLVEKVSQVFRNLDKATTFNEQLSIIRNCADYNKSKFKSLSKRRKKIFVKGFTHYNINTGMLVHYKRYGELGVHARPFFLYVVEETGAPFNMALRSWADIVVSGH